MADFFTDLFGGNNDEAYKTAQNLLNDSFNKQKELISGSADAGLREDQANADIAAQRGGYAGSPVEAVIKSALRQNSEYTKQAGLTKTQSMQSQAQSQLEMQKLADKRQAQANNIGLFSNIFSGLGNFFGYLNPVKRGGYNGTGIY